MLKYNTTVFDDYTKDDDNFIWSQVCKECSNKFDDRILAEHGHGICGVVTCSNEADFYIDFPEEVSR